MKLRETADLSGSSIAKVACLSIGAYFDIERDCREASFFVIFRIFRFYEISLQEFADIVSPRELERKELASLRILEKRKTKSFNRVEPTSGLERGVL